MARYVVEKTPAELVYQSIDFNPDLPPGMIVLTVVGSATDSSGTSAPSVVTDVANSSGVVSFRLTGGTAGEDYQVKIAATLTSVAFVLEHFVELRVRTHPYLQ